MLGPVAEAVAAEGEEQHQDEDQQDGAGDEEEESFLFAGLDQLSDQLAFVNEILRATIRISQRDRICVDAQLMVERVEDVLEMHGPILRLFAKTVGRANRLAVTEATTSQEEEAGSRPMVSTGTSVDSRRSTKLTRHHDDRVIQLSVSIKVLDHRSQRLA